jgi:hypothetical protein
MKLYHYLRLFFFVGSAILSAIIALGSTLFGFSVISCGNTYAWLTTGKDSGRFNSLYLPVPVNRTAFSKWERRRRSCFLRIGCSCISLVISSIR